MLHRDGPCRLMTWDDGYPKNPMLWADGYEWYLLDCRYKFGDWLDTQPVQLWQALGARHRCRYAVREDLMALIKLGHGMAEWDEGWQ